MREMGDRASRATWNGRRSGQREHGERNHRKAMGANRLVWHPSHNFSTRPACSQQNDEIGVRHRSDQIDSVRRTVHRTARWSALAVATAAFMTTACRDSKVDVAAADSSLARDITLASAVTAPTPELRDLPDSVPPTSEAPLPKPKVERKPPKPTTQPPTPVREVPPPAPPAPTPVVEDTASAAVSASGPRG